MEEKTALQGTKEISEYAGRPWNTVKILIKDHKFPAVLLNGRWESDKTLISNWRKRFIENAV